jgi:hypothetical protein
MLWRLTRELKNKSVSNTASDSSADNESRIDLGLWIERGIILGALGGLAGFFASGLVHYNWGDSEVVMIFYFIMGLSLAVRRATVDPAFAAS